VHRHTGARSHINFPNGDLRGAMGGVPYNHSTKRSRDARLIRRLQNFLRMRVALTSADRRRNVQLWAKATPDQIDIEQYRADYSS
jgi:hypothetical protein